MKKKGEDLEFLSEAPMCISSWSDYGVPTSCL